MTYRAGNQKNEGVQVSDDAQMRVTMVTGVRHNEQPGDLEAGVGAQVTVPPPDMHLRLQDADQNDHQNDKPGGQERTGHLC